MIPTRRDRAQSIRSRRQSSDSTRDLSILSTTLEPQEERKLVDGEEVGRSSRRDRLDGDVAVSDGVTGGGIEGARSGVVGDVRVGEDSDVEVGYVDLDGEVCIGRNCPSVGWESKFGLRGGIKISDFSHRDRIASSSSGLYPIH